MKYPCNLTLDKDLIKEIDKIAEKENRSRSYIINEIIEKFVKKEVGKK